MSEHNPNNSPPLRVVYSPLGEKFEVSPANFYDLTRNANWAEQKPHPDTVREHCEKHGLEVPAEYATTDAPVATPAHTPAETPAAVAEPAHVETSAAEEQTASGEAPEEVQEADEGPTVNTTPSDFADMDKDAVKAHIEATFPGTEIDGRKGRDALVAQALELAAASNA